MVSASLVVSCVHSSFLKYLPHISQCQYSLFPASVHVAATSVICSLVWPSALMVSASLVVSCVHSSFLKYLPHISQCQYSLFPASVHVAATSVICSLVWLFGSISRIFVSGSLQRLHVYSAFPSVVHVAGVIFSSQT